MKNTTQKIWVVSLSLLIFATAGSVRADVANIVNTVSVSSNSGGSSSSSGVVTQGGSSADVHVYTQINGQEVENFNQHSESTDGKSVSIQYENTFATSTTSSSTVSSGGKGTPDSSYFWNHQSGTTTKSLTKKLYGTTTTRIEELEASTTSSSSLVLRPSGWKLLWNNFTNYVWNFFSF